MHIRELYYQQPSEVKDCLGRTTYYNGILCVLLVILFTYLVFLKIISVFTLYYYAPNIIYSCSNSRAWARAIHYYGKIPTHDRRPHEIKSTVG